MCIFNLCEIVFEQFPPLPVFVSPAIKAQSAYVAGSTGASLRASIAPVICNQQIYWLVESPSDGLSKGSLNKKGSAVFSAEDFTFFRKGLFHFQSPEMFFYAYYYLDTLEIFFYSRHLKDISFHSSYFNWISFYS